MKHIAASVVVVWSSLISVGCGDLYRIRSHRADQPSGIPFFATTGACVQETVYGTSYYLVTLKVSVESSPTSTDTVKLNSTGQKSADFKALLAELDKPSPDLGTVQTAWSNLKQRQSFDPNGQVPAADNLLSNKTKIISVVDYSQEYDINQRRPLTGTANATFKVSPSGTLTEVQGQVEDKTLSTVLSALPLSDLIKSAAGIAAKTGAAAAQPPETVKFSLEQEERLRTVTYSRTYSVGRADPNCQTGVALSTTSTGVSMAVADAGAKDANPKSQSKDENSIGISATISLPKAFLSASTNPKESSTESGSDGSGKSNKATETQGSSKGSSNKSE